MNDLDRKLIELLSQNSRLGVSALARQLSVSRATVQEHMQRLERSGVIQAYTLRLRSDQADGQLSANVLIAIDQKQVAQLARQLEKLAAVKSLYTISGQFDLSAFLLEESAEALDRAIDDIVMMNGVERTQTSIMLSKKFER